MWPEKYYCLLLNGQETLYTWNSVYHFKEKQVIESEYHFDYLGYLVLKFKFKVLIIHLYLFILFLQIFLKNQIFLKGLQKMTDMNFNTTVNDGISRRYAAFCNLEWELQYNNWKKCSLFLQDTTMAIVLMFICLLILFFGIIGNIVTMT